LRIGKARAAECGRGAGLLDRVAALGDPVAGETAETARLPSVLALGEGLRAIADPELRARVEAGHLVPVRYVGADGRPTEAWPDNPSGSTGGWAGLCDATGRVFGLMPHPEAYLYPESHPRWIAQADQGRLPAVGHGLGILVNGVRACLDRPCPPQP